MMDISVVGQENIPGAKFISAAFYDVMDIAGNKKVDFIKGMLVEVNGKGFFVAVMMIFIKTFCHALTVSKLFLYYTARFTIFQLECTK